MAAECWRVLYVRPPVFTETTAELARQAEGDGWYGGFQGDSQHLHPECWLSLGTAIETTTTLRLAVGVTNADTRDPAVTASAAAGAQWLSGGRFVLGMGRGDSAVHKLGRNPIPIKAFEAYVVKVQQYLRGEAANDDTEGAPSPLWSAKMPELPKPPMDLAATGPKVIAVGARHTDQIAFSVGADPERMQWAIETARAARTEAGGDPDTLSLGAYLVVNVSEDVEAARARSRGLVAVHARFSSMNTATPLEGLSEQDREAVVKVNAAYQATGHGLADSEQARALDDDFIDRFAVIGPPSHCIEKLQALTELGIERFWILPSATDTTPDEMRTAYARFAMEVLPKL